MPTNSEQDVMRGLRGTRGLWFLNYWPWPAELPKLGPHAGGRPYARCADCPRDAHPLTSGTNSYYGKRPLCLAHARERAAA